MSEISGAEAVPEGRVARMGGPGASPGGGATCRWRVLVCPCQAASAVSSIRPMSALLISASMSIRISMRSATLPMPVM
jgi:hypothetical protein